MPLENQQHNFARSGCSCIGQDDFMRGDRQGTGHRVSAEDLLQQELELVRSYNKISQCGDCSASPDAAIKLLQQMLPLLAGLQASQEVYSATSAQAASPRKQHVIGTSPINSEPPVIEKDVIRLGSHVVEDPEELERIWMIILKQKISRIHSIIRSVRRQTRQRFTASQTPSVVTPPTRQVEDIESLIDRAQGTIWSITARFDLRCD